VTAVTHWSVWILFAFVLYKKSSLCAFQDIAAVMNSSSFCPSPIFVEIHSRTPFKLEVLKEPLEDAFNNRLKSARGAQYLVYRCCFYSSGFGYSLELHSLPPARYCCRLKTGVPFSVESESTVRKLRNQIIEWLAVPFRGCLHKDTYSLYASPPIYPFPFTCIGYLHRRFESPQKPLVIFTE
jgi:hypothetical protein